MNESLVLINQGGGRHNNKESEGTIFSLIVLAFGTCQQVIVTLRWIKIVTNVSIKQKYDGKTNKIGVSRNFRKS